MAFQYLAILALVAAASAGVLPAQQVYHAAPAQAVAYAHAPVAVAHAQPVLAKHDDEYDPHPQYKFAYDVQDSLSGDSKSQVEERDGDVVRGEYAPVKASQLMNLLNETRKLFYDITFFIQ
ncbi:larval cuticle protein A1A-like [Drosophila navojoa]|uniref:larval cuticle protein A1A-like n=1 Tax=Drosophila navojoa TaxID=7232 RepID=UPI0011BDFDD0|nr:larval cuticle protein A1A-like [Drosophila navojoa]